MMRSSLQDRLRALPSVDAVLRVLGDASRKADVRAALDALRDEIRAGALADGPAPTAEQVAERVTTSSAAALYPRTVNGTGVFLHTGLGRTPLAPSAVAALTEIASGFSIVEVDAATGQRNQRERALVDVLTAVTGAPSGLVVNNNAAALVLLLRTIGQAARARRVAEGGADERSEVIVSRGELIEIGGGFRLPDIMETAGVKLVEVGATNRTNANDFERAITPRTALLLRMHTSNYRIVGFHDMPTREQLVEIAQRADVPFAEDTGSGLLDAQPGVLAHEPDVRSALAAGVDLVCFSGDKLLGGPQAGILVGRSDIITALRADAMFRAFRPDRLTLAALAATLQAHQRDPQGVPVLTSLRRSPRERLEHARALASQLTSTCPDVATFTAITTEGEAGSGSVPGRTVTSAGVEINPRDVDAATLAERLRLGTPSVFAKLWRDRVVIDVLALLPGDDERVTDALSAALSGT